MESYLISIRKQFEYYQSLGQKTMNQVSDEAIFYTINQESNSLAMLVKHLHGNMLSRWTNFLTSDGEKESRKRDQEFDNDLANAKAVQEKWDEGWNCLFAALDDLKDDDLEKIVYIRNMGHTVVEAINRQLAHYAYHVGQMVYLGKVIRNEEWASLSIPKGGSASYNEEKFSKEKRREHFTDDL